MREFNRAVVKFYCLLLIAKLTPGFDCAIIYQFLRRTVRAIRVRDELRDTFNVFMSRCDVRSAN